MFDPMWSNPCVKCKVVDGKFSDTYVNDNGQDECPCCGYIKPFSNVKLNEEIEAFKAEAAKAASE